MKSERKSWLTYVRSFRFKSVFLKNLALIFCMLIIPFLCALALSFYSVRNERANEQKLYTDTIKTRIVADINSFFKEIREKAIMIGSSKEVKLFFYSPDIEHDQFYNVQKIAEYLSQYCITNEVIDSVYLYSPVSNIIISPAGRFSYDAFYDKECIKCWDSKGDTFQINNLSRTETGTRKDIISYYYFVKYGKKQKGVVIVNIDIEKMRKRLDYGENTSFFIIYGEKCIFCTDEVETVLSESEINEASKEKNYLTFTEVLNEEDMKVIIFISPPTGEPKVSRIKVLLAWVISIMIVLSFVLAIYISKKIYDPISEILHILEKENSNEFEDKLFNSKNELNYIANSIYSTTEKTRDIEQELSERLVYLKKAQAIALQAQINPHFLNNTLDIIHWMIIKRIGTDNEILEVIDCLSELLRISIGNTDSFISIKEEVEYVQKYLYIQRVRFEDKFSVFWDVPKEVENCKIIKLVLQPIVENAITYGIKTNAGQGELHISFEKKGPNVVICVRNSGKGISPARVLEINESIAQNSIKESNHIGLSNVNQRIKLAFSDDYGVVISSNLGEWTMVTITIPYQV